MKPLSISLEELAARTKVLENSATATFEADRASSSSAATRSTKRSRQTSASSSPLSVTPLKLAARGGTRPRRR